MTVITKIINQIILFVTETYDNFLLGKTDNYISTIPFQIHFFNFIAYIFILDACPKLNKYLPLEYTTLQIHHGNLY